ncbi:ATP-dependent zinc metalloprotease FtsH [Mariniblastus fucicola]|nr:ATP-dependent zinc metalloprotease FtsH [Mariniblastus fucicola]
MDQNSKRPSEPKNSSTTWFALIIVASLAVCLFLVLSQNRKTLTFSQFEALVAETKYVDSFSEELEDGYSGKITIKTKGRTEREFVVEKPNDLKISDTEIQGTCFYYEKAKSIDGEPYGTRTNFTVVKSDSDSAPSINEQLASSNIRWQFLKPSFFEEYGGLLLLMALTLGLFYFMIRRLGGAGGPMQFGRSRGKLYAEEDLGVSFSDVAGIDEAVEEVREVVDFLKSPEKYQRLGGKIPCGVLLVGPPGTGKTLLAKAIAGEADVPFYSLSGSDFVEMFVGVGAARVRDMFQQAEAKAPCIIFIDELDALGKTRGGQPVGGHDEREQTLNALLVEMDGFSSNSGVIVMAATNRPETLDQALMRPGRFDRHVLVDRPDVRGREEILKVHVKNVKLDPNVDLKKVAAISPGFGGAELANLVNEAALLAARKEQNSVVMENFNEAVERVTAGLEKKQRVMNTEEKQRVAYHEAGHALVAYVLPNTNPVHKVSIIPRGLAALGYTMQRPTEDRYLMTKSELESELQILVAGTMAEELVYKDISTGASNDLERATDIARGMVTRYGMSSLGRVNFQPDRSSPFLAGSGGSVGGQLYSEVTAREIDQEVSRIIEEAVEKVRDTLKVRKQALVALTERLIEVESVDSEELKSIMDENSPGPLLVPGTNVKSETEAEPDQNDEEHGTDLNAAQ